jgi:hypothetical protein
VPGTTGDPGTGPGRTGREHVALLGDRYPDASRGDGDARWLRVELCDALRRIATGDSEDRAVPTGDPDRVAPRRERVRLAAKIDRVDDLDHPTAVAVAASGTIYISNRGIFAGTGEVLGVDE